MCAVSGCNKPTYNLSRLCMVHMSKDRHSGDPLGRVLKKSEVRPFALRCRRFIEEHRDHPGCVAALEWIEKWIRAGANRAPSHVHRNLTDRDRTNHWLRHLFNYDVEPIEVFAWTAGLFLMREQLPAMFPSDRHWRHQLVYRVCRLAGSTRVYINKQGRLYSAASRVHVGVRALMAEQLVTALGILCLKMVERIRAEDAELGPVAGSDQPFEQQQGQGPPS